MNTKNLMNTNKIIGLIILFFVIIIQSSCNTYRRAHNGRFYVKSKRLYNEKIEEKVQIDREKEDQLILASAKPELLFEANDQEKEKFMDSNVDNVLDQCDSILLTNGQIIAINIQAIGSKNVDYISCGSSNGKNYLLMLDSIKIIKFKNGDIEFLDHGSIFFGNKDKLAVHHKLHAAKKTWAEKEKEEIEKYKNDKNNYSAVKKARITFSILLSLAILIVTSITALFLVILFSLL